MQDIQQSKPHDSSVSRSSRDETDSVNTNAHLTLYHVLSTHRYDMSVCYVYAVHYYSLISGASAPPPPPCYAASTVDTVGADGAAVLLCEAAGVARPVFATLELSSSTMVPSSSHPTFLPSHHSPLRRSPL